ncbi:ribonucleoside-diphosphate reductase subunit alpha, partial [Candidatus Azambacteria bacterium]|nr:ribonucleoside-diphosphate reductase subunit alpha [Candidatus Azambacteria bacterium]
IIYRYEHQKVRQEEVTQKIEDNELLVTKRSGKEERFSLDKLKKFITHNIKGYEKAIDVDLVIEQTRKEIYDKIKTADITQSLIMVCRSMIELDPAYSKLASRLLLDVNYKEVIGQNLNYKKLEEQYRQTFIKNIKLAVESDLLDKGMLDFDLGKLSDSLVIANDDLFNYLGLQTIYNRYFLRNPITHKVLETPQMFWMRIAMGMALREKKEEKEKRTRDFYTIMSELLYTPSTPTLFHSGVVKPQLSSCFLNTVPDDLHGIFKNYSDNAQLLKWSGGVATDWSNLRATGALIKGTGVESQGVIPFLKIENDVTISINRSGKRRGACCVYLEAWHYDIVEFLELRKNTGDERRRTHDINTAIWIPDLLMKRVKENGDWTLFSPDETPDLHDLYGGQFDKKYLEYENKAERGKIRLFKKMKAMDLWKKVISILFETGHPWITFKDPCNLRSPQDHVGVVHSSNLCTEITLNTSTDETAVCNLGSLNFAKFVKDGKFNVEMIKGVIGVAMRMLDNVIDLNYYPTEDAKRSNFRHRPVGLGVLGFQDALYLLGLNFDSQQALEFADYSMEVVSYYAISASCDLAQEKGQYETYQGSKWDRGIFPQNTLDILENDRGTKISVLREGKLDWQPVREAVKKFGMRNSNCLAIAPTATIANIVGSIPTIEPIYKNIYVKSNQAGDFIVVNDYLINDLKKINLWNRDILNKIKYYDGNLANIKEIPSLIREKYKEVFEIDPLCLIKLAAYRGKWIDQSQSLNIYYSGNSGKVLSDIYFYAWEMGLKTTYYLRTLAASQVEKSTVNIAEYGQTHQRTTGDNSIPISSPSSTGSPESSLEIAPRIPLEIMEPVSSAIMQPVNILPTEFSKSNLKLYAVSGQSCESCQ